MHADIRRHAVYAIVHTSNAHTQSIINHAHFQFCVAAIEFHTIVSPQKQKVFSPKLSPIIMIREHLCFSGSCGDTSCIVMTSVVTHSALSWYV